MREQAYCPVSLSKGQMKHVEYECPNCGWPTHYSRAEWEQDTEHGRYWPRLREVNEDEHDLRSGRELGEFNALAGPQPYEEAISMASWDVFFYTRGFPSIDSDRSRRHVSKLLTFPITVGTVLHESSPYNTRNQRLTPEGLRSLTGRLRVYGKKWLFLLTFHTIPSSTTVASPSSRGQAYYHRATTRADSAVHPWRTSRIIFTTARMATAITSFPAECGRPYLLYRTGRALHA